MKSNSAEAPPHSPELGPFLAILCPPTAPAPSNSSIAERMTQLRQLILLECLPKDPAQAALIRPLVWKLLLRLSSLPHDLHHDVHPLLNSQTYLDLVYVLAAPRSAFIARADLPLPRRSSRSASPMFSKIRNDTFRTLATDLEFRQRVGEERLVRCLEAFVWRQLGPSSRPSLPSLTDLLREQTQQPTKQQVSPPLPLRHLPSTLERLTFKG